MSGEPSDEFLLGATRPFVDPETGQVVMERPVIQPVRRKVPADAGYVMLNMEAVVEAACQLNKAGLLILMEAARQWRMGNGAVATTTAFCRRFGITRKQCRGAVKELVAFGMANGWVRVIQSNHAAARIEMTAIGMARLWRGT